MNHKPPNQAYGPTINRISDVMEHCSKYAFQGVKHLADDAGVNPSSVSRLINGKINPSFNLVARITTAIERELGMKIDPRDLVAEFGEFLTHFTCDLVACGGCLPDIATDEYGDIKPTFADITPGTWVSSRYPKGYRSPKGGK